MPWVVALAILVILFRTVSLQALRDVARQVNLGVWIPFVLIYVLAALCADSFAAWVIYRRSLPDVPLRLELDPRAPAILGDSHQLRQVVHNLLQNAQDATETAVRAEAERGVTIKTQWLEGAKRVRLSVIDNGTGFPDSILKRAFEPYVTTKKKGTGLGLAVVKKIADEHGARIRIANLAMPGEGGGDAAPGSVIGAQVSLSFSKLATTVRVAANEPVATSRVH